MTRQDLRNLPSARREPIRSFASVARVRLQTSTDTAQRAQRHPQEQKNGCEYLFRIYGCCWVVRRRLCAGKERGKGWMYWVQVGWALRACGSRDDDDDDGHSLSIASRAYDTQFSDCGAYRNPTSSASSRSAVVRTTVDLPPPAPHLLWAVVLIQSGPDAGKIAIIAEVIDHNRVRASLSVQRCFFKLNCAACSLRQSSMARRLASPANPSPTATFPSRH
jgi:hypothetical protein